VKKHDKVIIGDQENPLPSDKEKKEHPVMRG